MLITPSGVPWLELTPEMLVELPLDGAPGRSAAARGGAPEVSVELPLDEAPAEAAAARPDALRPSTEWRLHARILSARPEVGSVVHAHPPFATALSCLRRSVPPFHYMVAVAGAREIPCAPYATFGTAELAERVFETLGSGRACLMANHGMISIGATPDGALALAVEVEALAEQYCRALQVGRPVLLTDDEMARVERELERYGGRG
jgi:L-fuculose-phosphate aldolase